jgi:hypothetical protein
MSKLHIDELSKKAKRTKGEFLDALDKLPEKLDETYQNALDRIAGQDKDDFMLAQQVISWVHYCDQKLNARQLQHAIAIQNGTSDLESLGPDSLFQSDYLVLVCAGLVTCDSQRSNIRFVHYTTADYFRRTKDAHFPNAGTQIAYTCLINLNQFSADDIFLLQSSTFWVRYLREGWGGIYSRKILEVFPLLTYIVQYFVDHMQKVLQESLPDEGLVKAISKVWNNPEKWIALRAIYKYVGGRVIYSATCVGYISNFR